MKKLLSIFFCFATLTVSAQYYGYDGYYNYGGPAAAAVESQLNAMSMMMQQMATAPGDFSNTPFGNISWDNFPTYVPDCSWEMFLHMFRIVRGKMCQIVITHRNSLQCRNMRIAMGIKIAILVMDRANVRLVTAKVGTVRCSETILNVRIANMANLECAVHAMVPGRFMA